jgi:hypothetical protein
MMKYSQAPILPKKYLAIGLAEKRSVGASSLALCSLAQNRPFPLVFLSTGGVCLGRDRMDAKVATVLPHSTQPILYLVPLRFFVFLDQPALPFLPFMQLSLLDLSIFFYNDNAVKLRYIDLHATPLRLRSLPSIGRPD